MASVSAMTATQVLTAAERRQVRRQVRSVFGRYDAAGDGFVDESDLVNLLRDLTGKEPNKIDLQFALKAMDLSGDGRVSFDEMVKYWEANVVGHGGSKFNKLLVKDRVGAPRTSTYDLPPLTHKFGKPAVEREFGTKEIVQGWQGGDGSAPLTKVELQASRSHTKLKAKTFGKKGRPSTPVVTVMKAGEETAALKDPVYPTIPSRTLTKSASAAPRSTIAQEYRMHVTAARVAEENAAPEPWKMKKFASVKPRIVM